MVLFMYSVITAHYWVLLEFRLKMQTFGLINKILTNLTYLPIKLIYTGSLTNKRKKKLNWEILRTIQCSPRVISLLSPVMFCTRVYGRVRNRAGKKWWAKCSPAKYFVNLPGQNPTKTKVLKNCPSWNSPAKIGRRKIFWKFDGQN